MTDLDAPATKGKANISSAAEWAAICERAEQRATIRAVLAGIKQPRFPEQFVEGRYISSGKISDGAGQPVDGYMEGYTVDQRRAMQKREARRRDSRVDGA